MKQKLINNSSKNQKYENQQTEFWLNLHKNQLVILINEFYLQSPL